MPMHLQNTQHLIIVPVIPTGAVYLYPRCHSGGVPVRRDGHLDERVCGHLQRDAASGFPEQFLSAAGGVSGQSLSAGKSRRFMTSITF